MSEQQVIGPARPQRSGMIKGLFPSLPERGKIKIGSKGAVVTSKRGNEFQPPQKLDHFLVTTLERGPDGNFLRDEEAHRRLGDKPTEIPIRLLYDDPTVNFPTRYACYVGRSLWCSGDGELAMRLGSDGVPGPVACPCPRKEPGYAKNDKCKMNGVLSALIEGAGGLGGVWKFRTTSYNSIVGILSSLAFIRSITGGVLANIPLKLIVRPKQGQAPDGTAVTIYVVGIEFVGDVAALQHTAHVIALDRATTHVRIAEIEDEARKLLQLAPPNAVLAGDDPSDVVEEFYPEQARRAMAHPAVSAAGDLDVFAEPAEESRPDFIVGADFLAVAEAHADEGADAFRAWWKTLSKGNRDLLRDSLNDLHARAVRADAASGEDPFGLPPLTEPIRRGLGGESQPEGGRPGEEKPPALPEPASPDGRAEGAAGEALPPGSSDPPPASPAASPIAIVKPHGGEPDWPATRKLLVEDFYDLATIPDCDAFRVRNSATINTLRREAPDEFEIWDTLAATHERVRRVLHGEGE